ncbi:MAG: type VI secretion system protein TssL [Halomonadaceae bacterium]|nr:MAG: type VI secretion system protein TssL [Halomonadaceae bacterium]
MSDNTIIKPRPGARQAPPREPSSAPADDRTALAVHKSGVSSDRFQLPSTRLDPVVDEAGRVLALVDRLSQARGVKDLSELKRQCLALVRDYQQALKKRQLRPDTVDTASYCVCALLDETVLNSEWGQSGQWASSSLLSEFHSQTWAGTHFFQLVEEAQRSGNTSLLTLQYLCLSLGFKGRYRVEERGQEQLDILRDSLYRQICSERGRFVTPFDRSWKERVVPGGALAQGLPFWSVAAVCGVTLLLSYLWFVRSISGLAAPVMEQLTHLGLPERPAAEAGESADALYLKQILQTEIDRGLVEVTAEGRQAHLILGSEGLFAAGSSEVREDMQPVLSKISRALESTSGRILVTGHTGNQPIATSRYPSNWHLSLARATAVADKLAGNGTLEGRLWPEGRGEAEPRFSNDTAENRSRNRRVEITLTP